MPKFNIEATFSLYTDIEYDDDGGIGDALATDYEDNSYFRSESVTLDGGSITFSVEAEDEQDAENQAENIISEGIEVEDRNRYVWTVADLSFSIEKDEMSRDEAFVIVRRLLDRLVADAQITSEEREALDLVIQDS